MLAHKIAVENRHWTAAHFKKLGEQHVGNCGFSRTRKSGEEDRDALLVPWRIAAPQLAHHLWVREPCRNVAAFVQAVAQLGSGDVQNTRALRNLVIWNVNVLIFQIDHHVKRHHSYADGFLMLLE